MDGGRERPPGMVSIAVVGADHPNPRRSGRPTGDRRMEILLSEPGETVELVAEPANPFDGDAIAVFSARGVQIGYVAADRTRLIHRAWRSGRGVKAIFQHATRYGAAIRIGFDRTPVLPPPAAPGAPPQPWPDAGDDVPPEDMTD